VLQQGTAETGTEMPVSRLFGAIPVAVLRATCTEPAHHREISTPTLATTR
jgi:hypothetical protein